MKVPKFFRRLRDRLGGEQEEEVVEEGEAEAEEGLLRRLGNLFRPVLERLPESDDLVRKGREGLETVKDTATTGIQKGAGTAGKLVERAGEHVQAAWMPEDAQQILDESPLFQALPEEVGDLPPTLANVRWQSDAILALTAAGVLSLEEEIIHHTDQLFHAGLPTPQLSRRIFGQDYSDLHKWIDTVPGSSVPGGGITHRVQHGHDLEAAKAIYDEHGLEGTLVWMQHVGQDAFSITGVPAPVGGKRLVDVLVEENVATSGNASLLVSFNAVELAASFLAGAFALRLAVLLQEMKSRKKVKKRCAAALEARERGDLDAVIANYAEARSLSDDPALSLALGWAYREMDRPAAESFLAFRRAAAELGTDDRMIDVGGVAVSLRGLAYLLALVEAPQILQREDLRGAWREELQRMAAGAVASFESAAIAQAEPPGVSVGDHSFEWRPRPLSAAANYYLAARGAAAVPFGESTIHIPRLRTNAIDLLGSARDSRGGAEADHVAAVEERWQAELAEPAAPS